MADSTLASSPIFDDVLSWNNYASVLLFDYNSFQDTDLYLSQFKAIKRQVQTQGTLQGR